ncbi:MAG: aminoacyl-tRNA deacylase [Clostridia bacterium]|nr:aminoacyl-tRNA deacylase [Clostridia bacterium]
MAKTPEKTNVMRLLDSVGANYIPHFYLNSGAVSGADVAAVLGEKADRVFKTLVTVAASGMNYVFMVPVNRELDLKKAAKSVGEKKIEMIKERQLLPLTGYVHGGCSPIGMKKSFCTTIDLHAAECETIYFSGGKIGFQVEMMLSELEKALKFSLADITK